MANGVFISYAHEDAASATRVAATIDACGFKAMIDTDWKPGGNFAQLTSAALDQSSYMVLLVSKHSMQSHWVSEEYTAALAGRRIVLVPLRLDDTPVPSFLAARIFIDARTSLDSALVRLRDFLTAETQPVSPRVATLPATQSLSLEHASARALRAVAFDCITSNALIQQFLFDQNDSTPHSADLGQDGLEWRAWFDALAGASVQERVMDLCFRLWSVGELARLANWLETTPNIIIAVRAAKRRYLRQ